MTDKQSLLNLESKDESVGTVLNHIARAVARAIIGGGGDGAGIQKKFVGQNTEI